MKPDIDDRLTALSEDMRHIRRAIDLLLDGDCRDACDIPGYIELADRHMALAHEMTQANARSETGLLAKAKSIHPRDAAMRTDGAVAIALSLASDVLTVLS